MINYVLTSDWVPLRELHPRQNVIDTRLKLIELSRIQSEGTLVTQRLLHQ